jgi:uncharacterized protein (TIGR00369 family)
MAVAEANGTDFASLIGARYREAADGRARLELEATDEHLNRTGTVHGGVLATLADMAMGQALRSRAGRDEVPATSQLTVTYLRPGKPGRLVVNGEVRKQGESVSVCEADVEQDGRTLVHAVATFAVVQR